MGYVHALVLLIVSVAGAEGEQTKDAEMAKIDAANRTVKLVAVGDVPTRSHKIGAKFVEVEPNSGTQMSVVFFPAGALSRAKTTAAKNHVRTIVDLIFYSAAWRGERPAPFGEIDWREPQFELVFSIPKDPKDDTEDLSRWYLVSITPSEAKKEQPKAAEKGLTDAGEGPIWGPIFSGHRAVKLVGVRFSDGRQHDLLAKFTDVGVGGGKEIELGLGGPIRPTDEQTIVDVTHTRTILNVVKSSVSGTPCSNPRSDATQWREPLFDVIFSIPKDAQGKVSDFSDWSLVSIKMPQAKKTQPKPSDK